MGETALAGGDAAVLAGAAGPASGSLTRSIPLVLVEPVYQRRGIGTGLLDAALRQLRAGGVTAGSGGAVYIWPGVPRDLPAAVSFFAARGWRHTHDTLDLVTDLADYRPPPGAAGRAAGADVAITRATAGDLPAVGAFEACLAGSPGILTGSIRRAQAVHRWAQSSPRSSGGPYAMRRNAHLLRIAAFSSGAIAA